MQVENVNWGAPRIHGELIKLGFNLSEATVSKYMNTYRKLPSQSWRSFLVNHADSIAAVDFFTVPTVTFRVVYAFIVIEHARRRIVHFNVTAHPTAQWAAQQMTEAFPFDSAPRYLIRDNDAIYGGMFLRRVTSLNIKDCPSAPRSPWQNPYAERGAKLDELGPASVKRVRLPPFSWEGSRGMVDGDVRLKSDELELFRASRYL
jgi:transposase InsO family protein